MKRSELKLIYDRLSDAEKKAWAKAANYSRYTALYKYLREDPNKESYDKIVQALITVVGQSRFNGFTAKNEVSPVENNIDLSKTNLIKAIFNTEDKVKLAEIKNDIDSAFAEQLAIISRKTEEGKELIEKIWAKYIQIRSSGDIEKIELFLNSLRKFELVQIMFRLKEIED